MKTIKVRFAPQYTRISPSEIDLNSKINFYYDENYRKMYQLDIIIQTENDLLIELLEEEICVDNNDFNTYRDPLVILDNIFIDAGNMAADKNEYLKISVYNRYKDIIRYTWDDSEHYIQPSHLIHGVEIDNIYRIDSPYTDIYVEKGKVYDYDFFKSIGAKPQDTFFDGMN